MRQALPTILLLACFLQACQAIVITEFCPDPWQHDDVDEYIVLSGTGTLDHITVSDGEGTLAFPPGTFMNGSLILARSAPAYFLSHGRNPDFEWLDGSPEVPDLISSRQLRMANARDELMLSRDGIVVQKVAWPADVKPREGQVHFLENGTWDPRVLMIGQSRFGSRIFRNVSVRTFVSPDCSGEVFTEAINQASRTIFVNMYEFSSPSLGTLLETAKKRGIDVRVLVEGGPVGGISPAERSLIHSVNRSGIPVLSMVSLENAHAPYRYNHAKYLIIDNSTLLVTSENFKNSGLPPKGRSGNRGWGVLLQDPDLAGYFTGVFLADCASPSVIPYKGQAGDTETLPAETYTPEFAPAWFGNATVIPVLAPDTSNLITGLLDSARSTIEIEQAYIKNESAGVLNPYLSSAVNASRRGVRVRILLDSYWYNTEGPGDNDEMAALINRIAAAEDLPLEARCIDLAISPVEKIHNKGVIVDGERVLVSSINWNSNSPTFNREAGVIIDHPGAARYFRQVFEDDWDARGGSAVRKDDPVRVAVASLVILFLFLVYLRRRLR